MGRASHRTSGANERDERMNRMVEMVVLSHGYRASLQGMDRWFSVPRG